jgi:biopolymer transport protein TolR
MAISMGGEKGGVMMNLNVTPLIDVLLVLLIIFMIINPPKPFGLGALAPQPNKNQKEDPNVLARTIVVSITGNAANPQISINQTPVMLSQLGTQLADIFKTRNEHIMFVKGDPSLPFGDVAQIIDIAKGAEPDMKVGLITHNIEMGQ